MFLFYRSESNLFFLDEVEQAPAPVLEPEVTHHIFVVDRSGSMWGVIDGLKSSIEQVLAVEDATNSNVETSLISFSSHRDVKLHWSGVKVEDVNNLSNPYLGELRSIARSAGEDLECNDTDDDDSKMYLVISERRRGLTGAGAEDGCMTHVPLPLDEIKGGGVVNERGLVI